MRIYNVAVIGCGYWGPNLIRNFNSLSACQVTAVCDLDLERLSHIKKLYPGINITTNYPDIINDKSIDIVAIATPVPTHYPVARECLSAGKHTFIEKPMASTVAQCKELNQLAENKGLTLMVGHTFIYTDVVRKIKEIITSGEIGEVLYISSRRLNLGLFHKDLNVTWDLGPHDISIILYLLDEEPVSVNCQGKAYILPTVEDVTTISLHFNNNSFAMIQNSWLDPKKVRETTIIGTKKMIVYNDIEPLEKIRVYDKHVKVPPHYDTFGEFQFSYHYGDVYTPYLKQTEPLKVECQHLIDCINSKQKPDTSGLEGLKVVQILEAASQSLQRGGINVKIEY